MCWGRIAALLGLAVASSCALGRAEPPAAPVITLSDQAEIGVPVGRIKGAPQRGEFRALEQCDRRYVILATQLNWAKSAANRLMSEAPLMLPQVDCVALGRGTNSNSFEASSFRPDPDGYYVQIKTYSRVLPFGSELRLGPDDVLGRNPFSTLPFLAPREEAIGTRFESPLLPFEEGRIIPFSAVSSTGKEWPKRKVVVGPAFTVERDGKQVDRLVVLLEQFETSPGERPLSQWYIWSDLAGTTLGSEILPWKGKYHDYEAERNRINAAFLVKDGQVIAHYREGDLRVVTSYITSLSSD